MNTGANGVTAKNAWYVDSYSVNKYASLSTPLSYDFWRTYASLSAVSVLPHYNQSYINNNPQHQWFIPSQCRDKVSSCGVVYAFPELYEWAAGQPQQQITNLKLYLILMFPVDDTTWYSLIQTRMDQKLTLVYLFYEPDVFSAVTQQQ